MPEPHTSTMRLHPVENWVRAILYFVNRDERWHGQGHSACAELDVGRPDLRPSLRPGQSS